MLEKDNDSQDSSFDIERQRYSYASSFTRNIHSPFVRYRWAPWFLRDSAVLGWIIAGSPTHHRFPGGELRPSSRRGRLQTASPLQNTIRRLQLLELLVQLPAITTRHVSLSGMAAN